MDAVPRGRARRCFTDCMSGQSVYMGATPAMPGQRVYGCWSALGAIPAVCRGRAFLDAGALWALYRLYVGAERLWTLERGGAIPTVCRGRATGHAGVARLWALEVVEARESVGARERGR